jgi:hypothetical protein
MSVKVLKTVFLVKINEFAKLLPHEDQKTAQQHSCLEASTQHWKAGKEYNGYTVARSSVLLIYSLNAKLKT